MRTIFIGFSEPITWKPFSAAIKAVEGTPYSHTYLKVQRTSRDHDLIYQASGSAVNFMGSKLFHEHNNTIREFKIEISDETFHQAMDNAIDRLGRPYGKMQILGMAIVRLFERMGYEMKNPFQDGEYSYVCSEILWEILQELHIPIGVNRDVVGPRHVYEALERWEIPNL